MTGPAKDFPARRFSAGALAILLTAGIVWLATSSAGTLQSCEPPVPSDLLVVLAGGSRERLLTGLDLYRKRMAPRTLVTDPHGFPDAAFRLLESAGVPSRALVASSRPSLSTRDDARCIREVLQRLDLNSVLVVTSPYHCRRAQLELSRELDLTRVRVTVTSSVSLYMDSGRWWTSRQGWITVPPEYLKLAWAWLGF